MPTSEERFWAKVAKDSPVPECRPDLGPCWLWTASLNNMGYGQVRVNYVLKLSHRFAYELLVGPVPAGLELDHLCRTPACVNPAHLEPVTHRENMLRGNTPAGNHARSIECPKGHPRTPENTCVTPEGWRQCLPCRKDTHNRANRKYKAKLRAQRS